MFSQNIFSNQKHVTIQLKQGRSFLSRDGKELFVQRFVKTFNQYIYIYIYICNIDRETLVLFFFLNKVTG